jgi:predicted nucleic acid-binding protein
VIVVDASVVVDSLIGSAATSERLSGEVLVAPAILDAEVGGAVRRRWLHGSLDEERATRAVEALADLEILRFEHRALIERAWQLRRTVSFTDALYLTLTEQLGIPLVTADARISGAPGIRATVEVRPRG